MRQCIQLLKILCRQRSQWVRFFLLKTIIVILKNRRPLILPHGVRLRQRLQSARLARAEQAGRAALLEARRTRLLAARAAADSA